MTVTNSNARNNYTADGTNKTFTYAFKIYAETDIAIYVNNVIVTNYTLTGVKNDYGGTVIFSTAPTANSIVSIIRNEPLTQQINVGFGDNSPSEQYEEGLDRSVFRDQKINEALDRCFKLPPSTTANPTLPSPQGGYFFGWNSTGTAIVNYPATTQFSTINSVTNIASLRNLEPTISGQTISLIGHTTAGIGGGLFRADLSDTTTSDDSGLTIVTVGGKRWKRIIENGFIDSDMYGGDVSALLPNATTKYAMKLMSDYSLSSVISVNKSDITIDCNGFKIIPNQTTAGLQIEGGGETGDTSSLSSDMNIGSNTFVVTASTYNIGDYVFIKSGATFPAPNENNNNCGQIFKITNKNSFVNDGITYYTYRTDTSSEYDFSVANSSSCIKHNMLKNVVIDNFYLNEENYSQQFSLGLNLKNIDNLTLNNPIGIGSKTRYGSDITGRSFIKINNCLNVIVNNTKANHIGWYGIEILGACRNVKINGGYGHDCRHAVSINWLDSGFGEPIDVIIYDFIADKCTLSGLDSHDRGKRIKWVNCVSRYSVADSGFQQRCNESSYENCVAYGNALHGFVGRGLTLQGKLLNCEAYSNSYSGITYIEYGVNALNCKTYINADSGFYVASGNIDGGSATGNQYCVRVPYVTTNTQDLIVSNIYATANTGGNGNHVYFEDMTNYNVERATFNSCKFYGFTQTPFVGTPSGNKDGQFPLTDGNNKLTAPTSTKNRFKGIVTLASGTARVSVPVHRFISTSGTLLGVKDKIILSVRTASNAGALRYVLDTSEAYFDIFSTNSSDASVIEWEITGC